MCEDHKWDEQKKKKKEKKRKRLPGTTYDIENRAFRGSLNVQNATGRVGSDQDLVKISRVGSGRGSRACEISRVGSGGLGRVKLLGSRFGRRPDPTPDSNPNPNPDPKNRKQNGAENAHERGCAAYASDQEISRLRTMVPKCRPRYPIFKSKTPLKIPSPRLLNPFNTAVPFWGQTT